MILAIALAAVLTPPAAQAQSVGQRRKELDSLKGQIESKRKDLEAFQRMQEEIRRDLSRLKDERETSARRLARIEGGRRAAEAQKRELGERLAAVTMAEGRGRVLLAGDFAGYVRALHSGFPYYGRGELWGESFRRAAVREKAAYLSRLHIFEAQTEEARARALAKDRELHRSALAALAELRKRRESYQRKEDRYREAREAASRGVEELKELEDSARALTGLIRNLERQGGSRQAAQAPPVPRFSLPWPVSGRVVTRFGKERVGRLNSWVIHSGVEILTRPDAPVQPVEAGKVIFAGHFRSYGNVVIVDHGRGLFSIYGHLKAFGVLKGAAVTPESRLGTVGPSTGGGLLYFEIRKGAEALDPLQWLKKP